jgi:hypothetical protein
MNFQLDQAIEILRRTPATLNALLRGVPPSGRWEMKALILGALTTSSGI